MSTDEAHGVEPRDDGAATPPGGDPAPYVPYPFASPPSSPQQGQDPEPPAAGHGPEPLPAGHGPEPPAAWQPVAGGWHPAEPGTPGRVARGAAGLLVVVLVAVLSFGLGIGYARGDLGAGTGGAAPPADAASKVGLLYEAWNLIEQHYVDRTALDPTKLTYGAISGLVQSLGDTGHTDFLTPQEAADLSSDLSGKYVGIGVELSLKPDGPTIVTVFENSPAQKAGLRAGDLILAVEGKDVTTSSFDTVRALLRGPEGTQVRIRVMDPGATASREVSVTRAAITVPNVTWAMVPGSTVADVRLEQFADNAAAQLAAALKAARRAGATALILDLRGDPGGYVAEAVGAASQFLPKGETVFIQRDSAGKETASTAEAGGAALDLPLVALVDDGSASAAEILAGALQDNGRAKIVGVTTFGTGTVLQTYSLSDGSQLRIGVAEWLTPKGHQIWHNGITPDVQVTLPTTSSPVTPSDLQSMSSSQLSASGDTQLLRALQIARGGS